jgi:hypothetical protein
VDRHLAEARTKAETQLEEVEARIAEEEQASEVARQDKAAEPRRKEADKLLDQFFENVAAIAAPLLERTAMMREIGDELPLARGIDRLVLDELVARLRPKLDGDYSNELVRHWLRRLLAGPGAYGWVATPQLPERLQSNLGIVDR